MTPSDLELLQSFARDRSQDAFTELVRRHLNLVFSAALRLVRSSQLAEEVAQSVFSDLARDTAKLQPDTVLVAWLHSVTRRTAVDFIRKESHRQLREQIAIETNAMNTSDAQWTDIEPLLDEAVAALDETDRIAVLLRYFENKSLREVGAQLGVSDDTAQKRVSRAVEKLREFFCKRKITIGAGSLGVLITANAVQAAPVGLITTISAAVVAGTAVTTSTVIATVTKTIAMTTLQKTLITATVAVLAGAGIYEARQAAQLRDQVQTLQQSQAPLAEQIQNLQKSFSDATNRLADLLEENTKIKSGQNQKELLALRGKVTVLSNQAAKAAKDAANKAKNPMMNMSSDPLMLEQEHAQTSRKVKRDYAKLFADLNLPQDKADALNDLIVKKLNVYVDLNSDLVGSNPDQSQMDKMKAAAQKIQAAGNEINQLLGADDYSKFKNYEDTMDQRYEVSGPQGFARELPAGQALTSDQTEQLISAMAEVEQNFKFSSGARPTSPQGLTAIVTEKPASEINVDAFTAEIQQLDDRYLARAQSILTPDQITAFQSYLADRKQDLEYSLISQKASPSGNIQLQAPGHL
jgi:RNA polymerase sigma factor (sigma-70 family)